MQGAAIADREHSEQDRRISEVFERERTRLRNFIVGRVPGGLDVDDILQDVFYELVVAYRLMKPVERVGAWLFRVAQNRITDRFRKKKPEALSSQAVVAEDGRLLSLEDLLPSPDDGPGAAYARAEMLKEIDRAIGDLPEEQRRVFISHEIEGMSFKDLAAETGLKVNTLLTRKHSAVLALRRRLHHMYEEFLNQRGKE